MRRLLVGILAALMAMTVLPAGATQAQGCTYTVQPGDTVIGIAAQYGIPFWELQLLNQEQYPIYDTLRVGWVLTVPCEGDAPPAPPEAPEGAITARPRVNLNVRSGPSTSYSIIGQATPGQPYTLEARNSAGNWVLFNTGAQRGWFAAWLTDINGDVLSLPVSNEIIGAPPAPPDNPPPPAPGALTATPTVNLNIRSGPSTSYGIIGQATPGQPYTLEARNSAGNWVLFNTGSQRGWFAAWLTTINGDVFSLPVSNEVIGAPPAPPDNPPPPAPGALTATPSVNLNIRSGPSTSYDIIGRATAGQAYTLEARNNAGNWVLFNTGGQRGWLAAWLTSINGDVFSLPVSNEIIGGPPAPPPPPPPGGGGSQGFAIGGQVQGFTQPDLMRSAGMTWVKVQHKWSPGDNPADLKWQIDQAHAQGFKILISIPGQLYPDSIDFGAYPGFVAGVAALGADAIEVWNEQNYIAEWPSGEINASVYTTQMLRPAYQAIKAANPGTLVISGGPTPTGFNDGVIAVADDVYIRGMRDAGAANYLDCVGIHFNAGATSPDARTGHPADGGAGHYSWYFLPQYEVYTSTFPNKPLCYTEIGYVSADGYGSLPGNFSWAAGTSAAEHGAWLGRAAQIARQRGNVQLFIVFNVNFTTYTDNDPQAGYAILRPDGSCPACGPLAAAAGQ